MALRTIADALIIFKADTSDLRSKMRDLQGEEKKLAQEQLKQAEARNKGLEQWTQGLAKANIALETVRKAVEFSAESLRSLAEYQQLSAATAGVSIERLRQASRGLKTDTELLRIAQAGLGSSFKMSESQIEVAIKAMDGFKARGFETQKIVEKVGEAMRKGNIEPLKDLGINLDMAGGKAEQFIQLQKVLAEVSGDASKAQKAQTDEVIRAGVKWKNAMDEIKRSIGELVVSLQPLISTIADVASGIARLVSQIPEEILAVLAAAGAGAYGARRMRGAGGRAGRVAEALPVIGSGMVIGGEFAGWYGDRYQARLTGGYEQMGLDAQGRRLQESQIAGIEAADAALLRMAMSNVESMMSGMATIQRIVDRSVPKPRRGGSGGGGSRSPIAFIQSENTNEIIPIFEGQLGGLGGSSIDLASLERVNAGVSARSGFAGLQESFAALAGDFADVGAQYAERKSLLSAIFGDFDEYDAYAERMQALGDAVNVFGGALQSGFDAWVSGATSARDALKQMVGSTLQGISSSMFARAIEHGAMAVGALAFGDLRGAATHGKAAALNAAGALAVGAIARTYNQNVLGAGAAPGASAGAGGGARPGASGGGGSNVTVILGDPGGEESGRARARRVERGLRQAERYVGTGREVVYS